MRSACWSLQISPCWTALQRGVSGCIRHIQNFLIHEHRRIRENECSPAKNVFEHRTILLNPAESCIQRKFVRFRFQELACSPGKAARHPSTCAKFGRLAEEEATAQVQGNLAWRNWVSSNGLWHCLSPHNVVSHITLRLLQIRHWVASAIPVATVQIVKGRRALRGTVRAAKHKCNIVKAVARCDLVVVKDAGSYR